MVSTWMGAVKSAKFFILVIPCKGEEEGAQDGWQGQKGDHQGPVHVQPAP